MQWKFSLLLVTLIITQYATKEVETSSACGNDYATTTSSTNLLINSRKDDTGEWLTTFHAWKAVSNNSLNNITLDLRHSVEECEGEKTVHIKGTIKESKPHHSNDMLKFHPKCGKNAAITDDGLSVQKINIDEPLNGVVLTNRPLHPNELFEVKLDKKHNKFSYCLGIGITSYVPPSFDVPDHMYNLKSGNWMMYHNAVYINGAEAVKSYGQNFNSLQAGDRIGVKVSNSRTLNFYVNGVDQGPAASNIPSPVYGVFELYYNAAKGTIVNSGN